MIHLLEQIKLKIFCGDSRSITVKKNILFSIAIKGISIVISFLLVPMTLGYVSSELYGIWLTLSSIMVWLIFFDIGFTLGLKNKLAEAIALKDHIRGRALVSTTYFMMTIIFVPICIILECIIPFVNWSSFLNVNTIYNAEITNVMHVLLFFFCVQMIASVISTVASACQMVAMSSLFPVIGNLFSLIAIFFITKFCPPSLMALAFSISLMPLVVLIIASFILYRTKFSRLSPTLNSINTTYIKDLFKLGYRFFIIQAQGVILYESTNVLISNVSGPEDVTSYNIAFKLFSASNMIFNIMISPLWPAFTDAYTKRDYKWMQKTYRNMTKVCVFVNAVLLMLLFFAPVIYSIWISNKAFVPFVMSLVVCIYIMVHNWDVLQISLINGIGAIKLQTYCVIIGLLIHIPLSFILGGYFGAIGVNLSMIIINLVYALVFTIQIRKLIYNEKISGIWIK